ncbi:hypothetical protein B0H13DRAFT_1900954 [Mycena leptocephala]|nr:hypothetical protein B0H13DRAFT_1900954 [Mycena leptocephala]
MRLGGAMGVNFIFLQNKTNRLKITSINTESEGLEAWRRELGSSEAKECEFVKGSRFNIRSPCDVFLWAKESQARLFSEESRPSCKIFFRTVSVDQILVERELGTLAFALYLDMDVLVRWNDRPKFDSNQPIQAKTIPFAKDDGPHKAPSPRFKRVVTSTMRRVATCLRVHPQAGDHHWQYPAHVGLSPVSKSRGKDVREGKKYKSSERPQFDDGGKMVVRVKAWQWRCILIPVQELFISLLPASALVAANDLHLFGLQLIPPWSPQISAGDVETASGLVSVTDALSTFSVLGPRSSRSSGLDAFRCYEAVVLVDTYLRHLTHFNVFLCAMPLYMLEARRISLSQVPDRALAYPSTRVRIPRGALEPPTLRAGTPEQLARLLKMGMEKGKMELLTKILPTTLQRKTPGSLGKGLAPITADSEYVDVVLDAILNRRLSSQTTDIEQESQVYSVILGALFPHLEQFTPAQNAALFDIILAAHWTPEDSIPPLWHRPGDVRFRLSGGTGLLFGFGRPSDDLIAQLVDRCMGWAFRPYDELFTLFQYVALPMQIHWPDIAGTRILDTIMLVYFMSMGRPVPYDMVFQLAITSPAAGKHLLPIIVSICMKEADLQAVQGLLSVCDAYGATFERKKTVPLLLLIIAVHVHLKPDIDINERMKPILGLDGGPYKIEVAELEKGELMELIMGAMERLGVET